jgi:hypothetical protein
LLFDPGIKHLLLREKASSLNVGVWIPKLSPTVRNVYRSGKAERGVNRGIADKKKPAMGGAGLKSVLEEQMKSTALNVKNL